MKRNYISSTNFSASREKVLNRIQELDAQPKLHKATFSGGCFWCMEGPFEGLPGVEEAIAGYAGGELDNPSYEQVVSGSTGHRESVQVYYNPDKITFNQLLDTYWTQVDPTDAAGQFADRGSQYTTAIHYHNQEQKQIAQKEIQKLNESGKYPEPIVTPVIKFKNFYPAEDFHQDFYKHSKERYKQYQQASGRADYIKNMSQK